MESDVTKPEMHFQLLAWFEANKKQVINGAAILLVVSVVVSFFLWRNAEQKKGAGEALAAAFVPQITKGNSRPDSAAAYLKVVQEFPASKPAGQALLLAAASLFDQGKYSEAQTHFERFMREHRDHPFVPQAMLGVGACLEAQNKGNEAITAYRNLIDRRPSEAVIPQAKNSLARLYEAQNKPELAYPLYEEVARTDPYGSLGANAAVRAEELKAKHPELVPPVAPATNTLPITLTPSAAPAPALTPAAGSTAAPTPAPAPAPPPAAAPGPGK